MKPAEGLDAMDTQVDFNEKGWISRDRESVTIRNGLSKKILKMRIWGKRKGDSGEEEVPKASMNFRDGGGIKKTKVNGES